jgi:hypothetical protein
MRTPREALAYITAQMKAGTTFRRGMCKRMCREAYRIASDGSDDATEAWSRTRYRVPGAWIPGAFIWWTGGSDGHGHVAVMGWKTGHIRTVDYPRSGRWNSTTVHALETAWPGIRFAGVSLDIDGQVPRDHLPREVRPWNHS